MSKKGKGGRPNKYFTHVKPKLTLVQAWARDGLTLDQIASNLDVALSSFCEYKNQFPELAESLKVGKDEADIAVENALYKRALGYEYTEKVYKSVEMSDEEYYLQQRLAVNRYKLEHPEATPEELRAVEMGVSRYKMVVVEEKVKEVAPDTTAQIFWLKNRRPLQWRDKRDIEHSGGVTQEIRHDLRKLDPTELAQLEALLSKSAEDATKE